MNVWQEYKEPLQQDLEKMQPYKLDFWLNQLEVSLDEFKDGYLAYTKHSSSIENKNVKIAIHESHDFNDWYKLELVSFSFF